MRKEESNLRMQYEKDAQEAVKLRTQLTQLMASQVQ